MKSATFAVLFALLATPAIAQPAAPPRNVIIFVADGLRYGSVTPDNMPNLARIKAEGVDFTNSHSLFPTVTTANASVIATGHYLGDTGNYANTLYHGAPMAALKGAPVGFVENDQVLAEMNQRLGGNYLNETSLIARARAAGWQTAVIGKEGPTRIQDLTAAADGTQTIILDDATGHEGGLGLPGWFKSGMAKAHVGPATPASTVPDIEQVNYLMKATTRIILPRFKESGKPFAMLFWSRDPDFSQHNTKDSVGEVTPGINGPSGMAGARNADTMLGLLRAALKEQGLDKTTDIFVTADHGFVTTSHSSATSPAAGFASNTEMPLGFLAIDLAHALSLPLTDAGPGLAKIDIASGGKPRSGAGLLGSDPGKPDIVVSPNSGSDLVYLPQKNAKQLARRIVEFLATQDYVSGIFVNDTLGKIPGTLSMSAVGLIGSAITIPPAMVVSFRTFTTGCAEPLQCTVGVFDAPQAQGQGSHGSLSRAETRNFMAAIGPSFKTAFADPAPVSNADIAPTLAKLMGLEPAAKGKLTGRVITEALEGGAPVAFQRQVIKSAPGPGGIQTILNQQTVGQTRYFDAAGFAGKTVGLALQ